jgi:hypothetical protein
MARTTDAEVKKIIALNVLTDTTPFITTANLLVTQHLGLSGISSDLLAQIEKYLAAHFVALHPDERQLKNQKLGDATDTYGGDFGKMLDFTQYGQMVKMLDYTGTLAGVGGESVEIDTITVDNE